MFTSFGMAVFVLIILFVFVRRFFARRKPSGGKSLEQYLRSHERAAELQLRAMREETSRFGAREALSPVEAGLRELLELHGNPRGMELDRKGDALILYSLQGQVEITWELRAATVSLGGKRRNIHGNGHWQVAGGEALPVLFSELAPLMGHLAAVVRAMSRGEALEEDAAAGMIKRPTGVTSLPNGLFQPPRHKAG